MLQVPGAVHECECLAILWRPASRHMLPQRWAGITREHRQRREPAGSYSRTFLVARRWQSPGEAESLPMLRHHVPDYQLWAV